MMMRSRFDAELDQLNQELIEMGAMIESAIENACTALVNRDENLARATMEGDREVNQKERQIEGLCLRLLLQQQPVARDLRLISAAMRMVNDMERIGDQAQDISEIATFLDAKQQTDTPEHFTAMSKATIDMVHRAIDAFVRRDVALARQVIALDDGVDELFLMVKGELAQLIRQDREQAEEALDLLMVAKYFERIGDHAENIAEWVEFAMTGVHKGEKLS